MDISRHQHDGGSIGPHKRTMKRLRQGKSRNFTNLLRPGSGTRNLQPLSVV